ncbi:Uncharacterised protein [Segatella copri]|nr:Uncharacterised protein [Segatella copri]
MGKRLLRDPGAQLRVRNQRRHLRAVGLSSATEGRRPSPRRPFPDRSHLPGASRTAGTEHHSRKISERRAERRLFLPIEERISLSLA